MEEQRKECTNEVIVLNEGYSYMEEKESEEVSSGSVMIANCTCTLIKSHDCNIIVDTMTPWDGDLLLRGLRDNGVNPEDIAWVVSTHGHSDHLGNNNLFLGATHIVGTSISQRNRYFVHDFTRASYRLTEGIEVVATPGHTLSCVSLLVTNVSKLVTPNSTSNWAVAAKTNGTNEATEATTAAPTKTVAIVGDLFERHEDIADANLWLDAGSEDPPAQKRNRARMAACSDWIVPGHGSPFAVDAQLRQELHRQQDVQ